MAGLVVATITTIADDGRIVILPVVVPPAEEGLAEEPGEIHIIARSTHHYSSVVVLVGGASSTAVIAARALFFCSSQTTRRERCCRPRFHCVCHTRTVSLLRVSVITRTCHLIARAALTAAAAQQQR